MLPRTPGNYSVVMRIFNCPNRSPSNPLNLPLMAKPILLNWGEESVFFDPTRVDRSKINAVIIDIVE
jgi:hypothetical protein